MFKAKKISAMLLVAILAVACEKSDKKNELSSVKEYPGWRNGCPEGAGDDEWAHGRCDYEGDTLRKVYIASTYALLSSPKPFEKKLVYTCGYLTGDVTIESCSIESYLYPSREDALNYIFTNRLTLDVKEGIEVFRHMELPYKIPVCVTGIFSSYVSPFGRSYVPDFGIFDAGIFIIDDKEEWNIEKLNEILDFLLKKGKDISDFRWHRPCSPFEIRKGKIRYADVPPDCPDRNYSDRVSCEELSIAKENININTNVDGILSKDDIVSYVVARISELKRVYEKYLKQKPYFSGKVTLKLIFDSSGSVTNISIASSTTGYPEFDHAVEGRIAIWRWQSIKKAYALLENYNTTVTISLNFPCMYQKCNSRTKTPE
jgi:TonB family protein